MKEILKNKKLILTISSCIGVIGTALLTHIGTKRAIKKLPNTDISLKEEAKLTWKCYVPCIVVGTATVSAIIFNQKLTSEQIASILASAGLTSELLREYEAKTKEIVGEEKFNEIRRAVAKDHEDGVVLAVVPPIYSEGLISCNDDIEPGGEELFFDEWSKTWFRSTKAAVRMAEYHLNRNFHLGGFASLKQFYEFLGLPAIPYEFDHCGWGFEFIEGGCYWIDFEHTMAVRDDGEEYTIISFTWAPEPFTEDEEWSRSVY